MDGATPSRLRTQNLSLAYDQAVVVDALSLEVPEGKFSALVGANGSGKSTVLKAMARIMKPRGGAVYLDGKAIHTQPTRQVAQQLAILPQSPQAPDGLTVQELVSYGRFPYHSGFGTLRNEDKRMVSWALAITGMAPLAKRPVGELSGGQRQRAWIAMALAQDTKILLLDEPTTFLDLAYQLEVLHLLQDLNRKEGRAIVIVVHDLNHASRFADHIFAIKDGALVAQGTPGEVITPDIIRRVFDVEADIIPDPRTGVPLCIPYDLLPNGTEAQDEGNISGTAHYGRGSAQR
jgi:iron complex transport system ATP-binding protein